MSFNGVQQRAANSTTVTATTAWIRILKMYKADNGQWPSGWVCLGDGYKYGISGNDTTGTAQCRFTGGAGYQSNTTFNDQMRQYVGGSPPTPSMVTWQASANDWRRGIFYAYGGGGTGTDVYIDVAYAGSISTCPSVGGYSGNLAVNNGNSRCNYMIGSITDS